MPMSIGGPDFNNLNDLKKPKLIQSWEEEGLKLGLQEEKQQGLEI